MLCIYWIFSLVRLTHFVPRFSLFTWTGIKGTLGQNSLKHEVFRNSRPKLFCKKSVIRNFAKVTGKHLYQSLFSNKVAGWGLELYQKGLWHRWFPVNFAKFLRTLFLTEHLRWLLQKQPTKCTLRKNCSENMHQIYRRTLMPRCNFNIASLLKSHFGMGVLL